MIDICDLAVGLSRQLYGLTIASERPGHRMMEQWHPLGSSASSAPSTSRSRCGRGTPRSPSSAATRSCGSRRRRRCSPRWPARRSPPRRPAASARPSAISAVVLGGAEVGEALVDDPRVALVSATGSTRMGRAVAPRVAGRFGRLLLELGGNNAAIVAPSADLDLTVRGIVFSAAGTAGQRCTSLRRVIAHASIADELVRAPRRGLRDAADRLAAEPTARSSARWSTRRPTTATPTRWTRRAPTAASCWPAARACWPTTRPTPTTCSRRSCGCRRSREIVQAETFAPILYVMTYADFDEALAMHNDVPQGLSSSIFTLNVREAERFVVRRRLGLRHRQRQHRPVRRRDRRRVRRREGDRRRPRVRLGRVEGLHAARDQHRQLLHRAAAGAGRRVRLSDSSSTEPCELAEVPAGDLGRGDAQPAVPPVVEHLPLSPPMYLRANSCSTAAERRRPARRCAAPRRPPRRVPVISTPRSSR